MSDWDKIVKQARDCHTKQAWESWLAANGSTIATCTLAKPVGDIFRLLAADPQSLQYSSDLWAALIQGALASWSFELGREIAEFANRIAAPQVMIAAAQVYLESGQLNTTRDLANRALRLSNLSGRDELQLQMLICSSYAEEGKHNRATKILKKVRELLADLDLPQANRAEYLMRIGRMHFFLGQYSKAGESFYEASRIFSALKEWDSAAKALFNTAASFENSGSSDKQATFAYVEECRRISETHHLAGHLAHCEAFYGLDAHNHGHFAAAREHFRRGLDYLPLADKSFRRLHILSMLALTYLRMGRYHLASKFGHQTLELARLDESDRYKSRYTTLEAELLWEHGEIENSQQLLAGAVAPFESNGVQNLEEMSTLSRYNSQAAILGEKQISGRIRIGESLRRHKYSWLERLCSLGHLHLNAGDIERATECFRECRLKSSEASFLYLEALAIEGLAQVSLRQRLHDGSVDLLARSFAVTVSRIGDTPLKTHLHIILAAQAYQYGDFKECVRLLKEAHKSPRTSFADRFCVSSCLATIEGRSPRLTAAWQEQMLSRFVRTYFAPTLKMGDNRTFLVSQHYEVNLERHPALAELLAFLLSKGNFSAGMSDVQRSVWQQSTELQGWQQKIRNTIMRLRDFFPYTIAPLILHGNEIRIFREAILIQTGRREGMSMESELLSLLTESPMSSLQISRRLEISPATAKRLLKKLTDGSAVSVLKQGRKIYYFISP